MPNLKEIRNRISSVISTKQITSAMKMVAAARLRKAQDKIIQMRPYANKLHSVLVELCSNMEDAPDHPLIAKREVKKVLIVVMTSNRGLCGAFNTNVSKKAVQVAKDKYPELLEKNQVDFFCFGKKASDYLRIRKFNVTETESAIYDKLDFEASSVFANRFMKEYSAGEYDSIELVYNQFKNAAVQVLIHEAFLPVPVSEIGKSAKTNKDYILEPTKEQIISDIIPRALKIQLYKALLDSNASEHGARMTAMHKATDNASDLIRELRLNYNKARQAAITKEILEIVSGANALKG